MKFMNYMNEKVRKERSEGTFHCVKCGKETPHKVSSTEAWTSSTCKVCGKRSRETNML